MRVLLICLLTASFSQAQSVEDLVRKSIADAAPKTDYVKTKEIRHPDGTIETIYSAPGKADVGIKEESDLKPLLAGKVPCEVQGNLRTAACECGPTCDCDGCMCGCKPGYKCDKNGCTPRTSLIAAQGDDLPVITPDGKRFKNRAEYEATLAPKTVAPLPTIKTVVGAGLNVKIGKAYFSLDTSWTTTQLNNAIRDQVAIYGGPVVFYTPEHVETTAPAWYITTVTATTPSVPYYTYQPVQYYPQAKWGSMGWSAPPAPGFRGFNSGFSFQGPLGGGFSAGACVGGG